MQRHKSEDFFGIQVIFGGGTFGNVHHLDDPQPVLSSVLNCTFFYAVIVCVWVQPAADGSGCSAPGTATL